jgi:Fungal N-terminal domain of STAND proteins
MEPGTILTVITTSAKVLSLITEYSSDVKGARQDQERVHKEVKALHHVLESVHELAKGPNTSKFPILSSYIAECSPDIEALKTRLDPGKRGRAMKKLGVRALKWPFDKKEVDKHINTLERHKNTISAALSIDQT